MNQLLHIWKRLPVILRSIVAGIVVTSAGTLPWAWLASMNIKYLPNLPWSIFPAGIYLSLFWKYVGGKGWPKSTSSVRKNFLRANSLSSEVWGAAVMAGITGLVGLLVFSGLLNRMVNLPQQDASDIAHVPRITIFFMVIMGSIFAGVTEESGFRGYMQQPIEKPYGPWIAIGITGIMFSFLHFSHHETTLALMPFYFYVALIYGLLAYLSKSILPGLILHAAGDIFGGLDLVFGGRSEWQRPAIPRPLIWESGPDSSFWLLLGGFLFITILTILAYRNLAREVKKTDQQ